MPRPFAVIGFTVFFIISLFFNYDTGAITAALCVFAVALVISVFITEARKNRVFPCAFATGVIACLLLLSELNFNYIPAVDYAGKTCKTTLLLTDYPEQNYGNYYYDAEALTVDGEKSGVKLRVVFSSLPDAEPYDIVEGNFTFYVLGATSEEFLASNKAKGVFIGAYPHEGEYSVKNIPESEKPFSKTVVDIRKVIKNAVHRAVPGESGALATALLIGDRNDLSSGLLSDFRLSGMTHIICVSGFHLSLCAHFILGLLKKMKIGERISSSITAFAVAGFMLIAGMTYSVVRSGIMMLLYLLSNILHKKRDSLNSLGFALTVIALFNPFAMGSVGLQLSALSTLGLIMYSQYVKPKIDERFKKSDNIFITDILHSFIGAVMIPVSATAFTVPVLMKIYYEFNFAVYASNMLAVPIASLCIIFSAAAAVCGTVFGENFDFPGNLADFLCSLLIRISRFFADFDLLTFRADSDTAAVIVCGVLMLCFMSLFMAYFGKKLPGLTCALCAVIFTFGLMFSSVSRESETRLNILDVGNGTAVLASKNGENILIGCGGTEFFGSKTIADTIQKYGNSVDCMIVPSSDEYSSSYLIDTLLFTKPETLYYGTLPHGSMHLLAESRVFELNKQIESDNFNCVYYPTDNSGCIYLQTVDMSALVCFDAVFDYSALPDECKNADIVITRNDYPENLENKKCSLMIVNSENDRGIILQDELSDSGVRCVATAGCGDILIRAENGYISANRN
ncbi:MAG: ComEC/Rec2 family competence protein [Clostridia bacterium]|nr:ComEC/Rec2 family competence protein [Clostridia bacterium]